ncbi:Uncharacterised protein [Shewanella baltica]|nr:Uncharacterised protein [Shewanella baltica]
MGKSMRKIVNWKQYNQALVSRGSLTFWVDEAAVKVWYCHEHHGGRGRGFRYSDVAIETALMVKYFYIYVIFCCNQLTAKQLMDSMPSAACYFQNSIKEALCLLHLLLALRLASVSMVF